MYNPLARSAATWIIVAAVAAAAQLASAQDFDSAPSPDQIPGLVEYGSQSAMAPAPRRRAMSDWDLYAGSVYANTSPIWFQAEYLLWWIQGNPLPPLVTTSPEGTPQSNAGVLGAAGTGILFGDERIDGEARSGFRTSLGVRLGHWFDVFMDSELEFDFLWLGDGQTSGDFYARSLGESILARPFFNAEIGGQDAQLIAFPDVAMGDILIETSSDVRAAGAMYRHAWLSGERARIDWLFGYRYMELQEQLSVHENLISIDPGGVVAAGTGFDLFEQVGTWNEFHGGDLGLQLWTEMHGWTVELKSKLALGGITRAVEFGGDTLVLPPGDFQSVSSGGLLVLPTNLGRHHSSRFSALPELSVKLRRQVTRNMILTLGYSLMVLDHVVRTGDQLDLVVNPTQLGNGVLTGAARPTVLMNDSTLWLHGFTLGLEW